MNKDIKYDDYGRGEAVKAVVARIGHGITVQDCKDIIKIILENWSDKQNEQKI